MSGSLGKLPAQVGKKEQREQEQAQHSHISVFHSRDREHPPTYLVCQKPDFNQKVHVADFSAKRTGELDHFLLF